MNVGIYLSPCMLNDDPSPSHNSGKIIFVQICRALARMLCLALPAQNQFYSLRSPLSFILLIRERQCG